MTAIIKNSFFHLIHFTDCHQNFKYQMGNFEEMAMMEKSDIEFWNGFLKGIAAAEIELERIEDKAGETEEEGIKVSRAVLRELKEKVERLHGEDVLAYLKDRYD